MRMTGFAIAQSSMSVFLEELTTDKYKYTPFKKKKSVVHKSELEKAQLTEQ